MTAMQLRLAGGAALAAVVAGVVLWPNASDEAPSAKAPPMPSTFTARGPATSSTPAASGVMSTVETTARLFELGLSGDLTVDVNTRGTLDVLQAELGPNPTEADYQRLEDAMRRAMPGEAATQAMALVRHYADYTRSAAADAGSQQPPTTADELKALLDKTAALRRSHFDASTAQALFGAEEAQTHHDLAAQALQADTRLSPQEKASKLEALSAQLRPEVVALQSPPSLAITEMESKLSALRQQAAPATQIEQVRRQYLGAETAVAMGEMEAQRAGWESRYQAYLQQKKTFVASASTDAPAQLEMLLRQHFSEEELAAARAYDRAHPQ